MVKAQVVLPPASMDEDEFARLEVELNASPTRQYQFDRDAYGLRITSVDDTGDVISNTTNLLTQLEYVIEVIPNTLTIISTQEEEIDDFYAR